VNLTNSSLQSFVVALTARVRMFGICDYWIKENIETFEVLNS